MATVDLYRMRKVGTQALPGVRMTAAETALSEGAGVEQERAQKFDQVTRLGQRVTLLGQELGVEKADTLAWETQKANTLKALQTSNDLDQWTATALYDPKTGALLTKGPATLGITQKVLDDFDKKSGEIAQGLSNDTQRIAFAKQRQQQRLSIQVTLDRHADSEMQKYRADELNSFVTNQRANAVANANDPRIVAVNLHTAEDAINLHAPELGLGPEKQQELIEATRTSTHAGVIMALLSQQQVKKAQAYFDHAKDEITVGDTRATLEKQLDVAGTKQQGLDASTKIWDQLGPKGENDPINIDKMEDAARKQFANDPDALEATMHFLRERKSATDAGRKDREEAQLGGLWSKVAAGAGLAEVSRDPAYLAAPGRVQLQVNDYILGRAEREASRAYAQEGRAYTAAQRLEHEKEQKGWSRYWELSDPKTLNATSENALQAMRGELGDEHVNRLLAGKRQLQKGDDKVRAATIDDDLFKTIASGAGLHPYETKGKTEAQNAELGQLRAAVEARIDQEQQAKGKELTRSEKEAVMHEMVDKKVYLNVWGRDPQTIAALVTNPENRAIAYVPIKDIHPNKLTQYLNYARSLGAAQQRMSDADLQQRYSDRFQHAEALRLLGAKDEEIAAAIRGQ